MAAVGAEVTGSWLLSSGVVSFFIVVLLLSIFLTALCTDCGRHSFELRDPEVHRNQSTLISVVKLEEVRENPMIDEIQKDEKQVLPYEGNLFTPWKSHLGAPQTEQESRPEEEPSVQFTPWRSHLVAPQSQDLNSDHIYHSIGADGTSGDMSSIPPPPLANHKPTREHDTAPEDFSNHDGNSVYARVSKKLSSNASPPPVRTCEETQVEEKEEEEEPSPPLPERMTEMEG